MQRKESYFPPPLAPAQATGTLCYSSLLRCGGRQEFNNHNTQGARNCDLWSKNERTKAVSN